MQTGISIYLQIVESCHCLTLWKAVEIYWKIGQCFKVPGVLMCVQVWWKDDNKAKKEE